MAQGYVKNTKDNVDFPRVNLWHLNSIKNRLEQLRWNRNSLETKPTILVTISEEFPYCHDSVTLVTRMLSDDKWRFSMSAYQKKESAVDSKKSWYLYTWSVERKK